MKKIIEYLTDRKHSNKRVGNIAMFHSGRCGSTVLGDLLNQHNAVYWDGEIFNDLSQRNKWIVDGKNRSREYLKSRMVAQESKYYGFETKFLPELHLGADYIGMPLNNYLRMLRRLNFDLFIILTRKNYLRRAVSAEVGRATNDWHSSSTVIKPTKVRIDVDNFRTGNSSKSLLELFRSIDNSYLSLEAELTGSKYIKLVYEDDILVDPMVAFKKVAEFIGIDYGDTISVRLNRTNPFDLVEIIVNYNEVVAYFEGTEYEWMLEL